MPIGVYPRTPLEERFWEKVNKDGPIPEHRPDLGSCWVWTAATNPNGYGKIVENGHFLAAHRVSYEMLVGPIPKGLEPDHLCRNHPCVNPDHLEPVTHKENHRRGKWAMTSHCPQGHPYDAMNTVVEKDGWRKCRVCVNERARQYRVRMKAGHEAPDGTAITRGQHIRIR